jgi:hypothetical protein
MQCGQFFSYLIFDHQCLPQEPKYKEAMWGSNYRRLYDLKSLYDPDRVFWVTPGVGAEDFTVKNGRLCRTRPLSALFNPQRDDGVAPTNDNRNFYRSEGNDEYKKPPASQEDADSRANEEHPA